MSALLNRATYFYEMGVDKFNSCSKDLINKDNDLACCIGFTMEQALELALKEICGVVAIQHPETHKLAVIINAVRSGINKSHNLDLVAKVELKQLCEEIYPNVRFYNNLAYGARYVTDLEVKYTDLSTLNDITQKMLKIARNLTNGK